MYVCRDTQLIKPHVVWLVRGRDLCLNVMSRQIAVSWLFARETREQDENPRPPADFRGRAVPRCAAKDLRQGSLLAGSRGAPARRPLRRAPCGLRRGARGRQFGGLRAAVPLVLRLGQEVAAEDEDDGDELGNDSLPGPVDAEPDPTLFVLKR